MERNDWKFPYSSREVAFASKEKCKYHEARRQFWQDEREDVVEKIRAEGIEVREYEITGGKDAQVVVDPELGRRLSECQSKIGKHTKELEDYDAWTQVLEAQPETQLELDHQDVLYFGLQDPDLREQPGYPLSVLA